jgi:hypothetical protein
MRAAAASTAALLATLCILHAAPAAAQEGSSPSAVDTILDGLLVETKVERGPVLMTDGELSEERGGFFSKEWAQGINFGAVLTTYINGKVAMATQLTMGSTGVQKSVSSGTAATGGASSALAGEQSVTAANEPKLTATNTANTITGRQEPAPTSSGSLAEQAAAAGINLNQELSGWDGVVVPGEGGGTAVLQSTEASRIAQVVLNTANGVNIQQNTNITLDIPGFAQLQQGFASDVMKNNIQGSITSALGAALRR